MSTQGNQGNKGKLTLKDMYRNRTVLCSASDFSANLLTSGKTYIVEQVLPQGVVKLRGVLGNWCPLRFSKLAGVTGVSNV